MFYKLLLGTAGIYSTYLIMSVVSEGLYHNLYESTVRGKDGEIVLDKFTHSELIVWFSSLLCALYGTVWGAITRERGNPMPYREQLSLGLLYTFNILPAYEALLYISYPLHALTRNCRFILVVLVGVFFSRVQKGDLKLSHKKIYTAVAITFGVIMFNLVQDSQAEDDSRDSSLKWRGYLLMLVSIVSDAFFSDNQAYNKATYKPSSNHLFTSANLITGLLVLSYSFLTGKLIPSLDFCFTHSRVMIDVTIVSVLQVFGQLAIYYVIANFKQHIFPMISTTRKIVTVLLSIYIYSHAVNYKQWVAMLIVFLAMGYEVREEVWEKQKAQEARKQAYKRLTGQELGRKEQ